MRISILFNSFNYIIEMGQTTPNTPNGLLQHTYDPQLQQKTNNLSPFIQSSSLTNSMPSNLGKPLSSSQAYRAAPLNSSQIINSGSVPHGQPITSFPQFPSFINGQQTSFLNLQSSVIGASSPSIISFNPQLGPSGSMMKKPNELVREKHVSFQSGLEELLTIRQTLRSTKTYFSKISPHMQQQLTNIRNSVQNQFMSGIPDLSKMFYHLLQQKNYKVIFSKISEFKHKITFCIDTLRKKNNVTKQQFSQIINITNDSSKFARKLAKELPVNGWKAVLANTNNGVYTSMVTYAQKDPQVVQVFQTLQKNVGNSNFHYVRPIDINNIYQSRVTPLIESRNLQEINQARPSTPSRNTSNSSFIY